jgi:hypothetical protein
VVGGPFFLLREVGIIGDGENLMFGVNLVAEDGHVCWNRRFFRKGEGEKC